MAARGSIPEIMKAAGIDMLAPEAGIAVVRRELTAGTRGEVVIAEGLGVMLDEDPLSARMDETFTQAAVDAVGPMGGRVAAYSLYEGLVVETDLDPLVQPFLDHHRIDGTAVLPGVMGLEAMAEAARLPFPELHVVSLEDVHFLAPFKFYRDESRTVTVQVQYHAQGGDIVAECRLLGTRVLVGREDAEVTVHFTGRVRMAAEVPERECEVPVPEPEGDVVESSHIYATYFHGPAYQVLRDAWGGEGRVAGRFAADLPANHEPAERPTLVMPRIVELAFQTAGLAEIARAQRMGLPFGFQRLTLLQAANGEVESAAVVQLAEDGSFDVDVADTEGCGILSLRGYRTSALPGTVDAAAFDPLRG